jgi:hypothetical protein
MNVYQKTMWAWICVAVAAAASGLSAMYVSGWFVLPFFGVVFGGGFVLRRIECPKCGTAASYDGTLAGRRFYGGFIHRNCRRCGWDLKKIP